MRLTQATIKKIIKEEITNVLEQEPLQENALELTKKLISKEKQNKKTDDLNEEVITSIIIIAKFIIWLAGKFALASVVLKVLDIIFKKIDGALGGDESDPDTLFGNLGRAGETIAKKLSTFFIADAAKMYIKWRMPDGDDRDRALAAVDKIEKYISFVVLVSYFCFEISQLVTIKGMSVTEILSKIASDMGLEGTISEFIEAIDSSINIVELGIKVGKASDSATRAAVVREVIRNSQRIFQALFS